MLVEELHVLEEPGGVLGVEGRAVDHGEVLCHLTRVVRNLLAFQADDLDGQPARRRDVVAQDIARISRKAHDHAVGARLRRQSLTQRLRQAVLDRQFRLDQGVALGVNRPGRAPLPVADLVHDVMHRRGDVVEGLLLVGLNGFDRVAIGNKRLAHFS